MRGQSVAERIVWFFRDRGLTEAHRIAIEDLLRIDAEQWDQSIARARDLGIDDGLALTPIYDRDGWWTVEPTKRIAAMALFESNKRNLGEAKRNARVLSEMAGVNRAALLVEASQIGIRAVIEQELADDLAVSAGLDYVIARVDKAEAAGRLVVERERVYA